MSLPHLTENDTKHWFPIARLTSWLIGQLPDHYRVLEVGPGRIPFPRADVFVDYQSVNDQVAGQIVHCDVAKEPLPFKDKEFDFVYCRHVVEDMYNPFLLCREMSRVAKAGYLETPSPIAEMCRGIDDGSPKWRGYCHHRYFVWVEGSILRYLTKYPLVEHLNLSQEKTIVELMRQGPAYWNSYYLWENEIELEYKQLDIDYTIPRPCLQSSMT